jgi:hypothetical protein
MLLRRTSHNETKVLGIANIHATMHVTFKRGRIAIAMIEWQHYSAAHVLTCYADGVGSFDVPPRMIYLHGVGRAI